MLSSGIWSGNKYHFYIYELTIIVFFVDRPNTTISSFVYDVFAYFIA